MTSSVADLIKVHVVIRTESFEGHGSTKDSKQNDKQSVANTEKQITIPLKKRYRNKNRNFFFMFRCGVSSFVFADEI